MPLSDTLKQGLAAMGGAGVNPNQLYGSAVPANVPLPVPTAAPPMPAAYGPPASLAAPAPPSFTGTESGNSPQPGAALPGVYGGITSNAPPGTKFPNSLGENGFGVHPGMDIHSIADYLLPKVRSVESSGNYGADRSKTHPGQTASGAYQYIDGTWNGYGGYKRAVEAPANVQDERMKSDLLTHLTAFNGDPFKTVAAHFLPAAAGNPEKWNEPTKDGKGRIIPHAPTVAQYVSSVLPKERVDAYLAGLSGQGAGSGM